MKNSKKGVQKIVDATLKISMVKKVITIVSLSIVLASSVLVYQVVYDIGLGKIINDNLKKVPVENLIVHMSAEIEFKNSDSKGELLIENSKRNRHNVIVNMYLIDEDGNTDRDNPIYVSRKLKPGEKINSDKLNVKFGKGNYNAIAYFNAYDSDNNFLGKTGIKIKIIIKEDL